MSHKADTQCAQASLGLRAHLGRGFMVTLDNLVVTTALPVIRSDLGAGLGGLEWTVNAYTLTFAVLLLTGAALGDRFGRRRMLAIGLSIFTVSSAAAALAPSILALDVARAFQGVGGAIVMPLTLTILSAAVPAERRGLALGAWGGISGSRRRVRPARRRRRRLRHLVAVDLLAERADRARPDPARRAAPGREPRARSAGSTCPGLVLAGIGLLGITWGLIRGNALGWSSPQILGAIVGGLVVMVGVRRCGSSAPRRRCCRCASSATGRSRSRTPRRSSSRSGCSARSSCSRSSSRPSRATRRSPRACGSCRGRRCR